MSRTSPTCIHAPCAPAANGHYSHGVSFARLAFTSLQLPIHQERPRHRWSTVAEETLQALDNLDSILRAAGSRLTLTLRVTLYLASMEDWAEVDRAYEKRMGDWRPARGVVQVGALHMGYRVGADAIGCVDER